MPYDELSTFTHSTAYRPLQCVVCERFYNVADIVATIEDDSIVAHCCYVDAMEHNGHGAFERYSDSSDDPDLEDMGKALILEAWSNSGMEDDVMSNEGWGYCGRFGRFLFMVDTFGFRTFEEYADDAKAGAAFDHWYSEGWGADESDAYISHEWNGPRDTGGWSAYMDGKELHLWPRNDGSCDERRAIARVRLESMKTGYWPNLWRQNERGDLTNLSY